MTTIHQLNPPFHLWIPEANDFGLALFLIDYHMEEHLYWVCAMEKTGEIWTLSNDKVRADVNRSIGRVYSKKESAYEEDTELGGLSQFQPSGRTKEFKIPPSLRVREPKVHLDVPDASGDRERENPATEKVNSYFRNLAAKHDFSWHRVDTPSLRSGKTKRRKGPHKTKHSRRAKFKS